jgi:hypothetical protein
MNHLHSPYWVHLALQCVLVGLLCVMAGLCWVLRNLHKNVGEYAKYRREYDQYIRENHKMLAGLLQSPDGNIAQPRGQIDDVSLLTKNDGRGKRGWPQTANGIRNFRTKLLDLLNDLFGIKRSVTGREELKFGGGTIHKHENQMPNEKDKR